MPTYRCSRCSYKSKDKTKVEKHIRLHNLLFAQKREAQKRLDELSGSAVPSSPNEDGNLSLSNDSEGDFNMSTESFEGANSNPDPSVEEPEGVASYKDTNNEDAELPGGNNKDEDAEMPDKSKVSQGADLTDENYENLADNNDKIDASESPRIPDYILSPEKSITRSPKKEAISPSPLRDIPALLPRGTFSQEFLQGTLVQPAALSNKSPNKLSRSTLSRTRPLDPSITSPKKSPAKKHKTIKPLGVSPSTIGVSPSTIGVSSSTAGVSPSTIGVSSSTAGVFPSTAGVSPSTAGVSPSTIGLSPSTIGVSPSTAGVSPSTAGVSPSTAGVSPSTAGVSPSTNGVSPSTIGVSPSTAGVSPSTAGVSPSTAGVSPSTAGVSPSTIGVSPSTAGVSPSTAGVSPSRVPPNKANWTRESLEEIRYRYYVERLMIKAEVKEEEIECEIHGQNQITGQNSLHSIQSQPARENSLHSIQNQAPISDLVSSPIPKTSASNSKVSTSKGKVSTSTARISTPNPAVDPDGETVVVTRDWLKGNLSSLNSSMHGKAGKSRRVRKRGKRAHIKVTTEIAESYRGQIIPEYISEEHAVILESGGGEFEGYKNPPTDKINAVVEPLIDTGNVSCKIRSGTVESFKKGLLESVSAQKTPQIPAHKVTDGSITVSSVPDTNPPAMPTSPSALPTSFSSASANYPVLNPNSSDFNLESVAVSSTANTFNPTTNTFNPAATINFFNPAVTTNSYNPAATTITSNPAVTTNSYIPAATINSYIPAATTNSYNPAATTNAFNPAATTNSVNPAATTNSFNPTTNSFNPAVHCTVVQPPHPALPTPPVVCSAVLLPVPQPLVLPHLITVPMSDLLTAEPPKLPPKLPPLAPLPSLATNDKIKIEPTPTSNTPKSNSSKSNSSPAPTSSQPSLPKPAPTSSQPSLPKPAVSEPDVLSSSLLLSRPNQAYHPPPRSADPSKPKPTTEVSSDKSKAQMSTAKSKGSLQMSTAKSKSKAPLQVGANVSPSRESQREQMEEVRAMLEETKKSLGQATNILQNTSRLVQLIADKVVMLDNLLQNP